jgi:Putative mono-oxygenase ydhR
MRQDPACGNLELERNQPMSPKVNLQIQFDLRCTPAEYRGLADHVAGAIAAVPGLLWKIWILDEERGRGGGIYLFQDRVAATAYLEGPIVSRLRANPAVTNVEVRLFDVLDGPSVTTRGLPPSG